jgi:signal transduction histidine kinase
MIATVVVIGELADRDNFKAKVDFQVKLQTERFIDRYEVSSVFRKRVKNRRMRLKSHREKDSHWPKGPEELPLITIHDANNQQILGGKKTPKGEKVSFSVTSESGGVYQVAYYLREKRDYFERWQTFIFSVQALLILLSATIASFVISAIVVRPMNQLRGHVQRLKDGEFSVRVDDKLSLRGDEIGDFAREFNQMAEYVEGTLNGQQQLFQNVSHELRAPLARLLAASGIIEQQVSSDHPAVARIQLECERLNLLIDELLSLAKMQQQQSVSAIDVYPIIEKIVSDSLFSHQHRALDIKVSAGTNCIAMASQALFERALSNVIGNSLKHTEDGVKISIEVFNPNSEQLQISVLDNGKGVDSEQLSKLCEPFYRLDTNVDGHGLGLGIAKQAMTAQQGELSIENIEPQGLKVNLLLMAKNKV